MHISKSRPFSRPNLKSDLTESKRETWIYRSTFYQDVPIKYVCKAWIIPLSHSYSGSFTVTAGLFSNIQCSVSSKQQRAEVLRTENRPHSWRTRGLWLIWIWIMILYYSCCCSENCIYEMNTFRFLDAKSTWHF